VQDEEAGTISILREGEQVPILTQNARSDHRPYLHPIVAPDGNGNVTEYSPGHHPHQTGLYWGFTRVNGESVEEETLKKWFYRPDKPEDVAKAIGRDFFHHPGAEYWRLQSATVTTASGEEVGWQTVYDMLDATGAAILTETQTWTMRVEDERYVLDLEWSGEAHTRFTVNEFDYGGLFLRMPWHEGVRGEAVNAARQRDQQAEGQRAMWLDVGMQVEGRDDLAHIAIFDHPTNGGYPTPWRVDGQLGVGPVRARLGDWTIEEGSSELVRHRLIVYTGDLNDLELTEEWQDYSGSYYTAALWGLAQEEGRSEKFLSPNEAAESMTLMDGFAVNAWASEPMITQPMAFAWDDRGRMWVAENRDYESRGRGFSNSGDSRILILEDSDGDGTADSRKVFAEGISFPSALAVGFGGVFVGAPPNLLFIPDRDGDDRGDMDDLEILLTGWGIRDRHETVNSFHWGPDGWLYGLEGFATPSKIRKPKDGGRLYGHGEPFPEDLLEADGVDINGGVWRYHPLKQRFEVVGHGFSNPWGIDYDAKGQLFISACVIPHAFHVVPGGIYHRQGGQHFNPYVYSDIRTIVDHRHRSAHGGARVYLSDAFPEEHHGRLFMANIHEHAVLTDTLEPQGSGFVARHGDEFLLANNAQWVGFSMEIGPAGDVYVLDWHDASICGDDVLHKDTGRIFRVVPTESLAEQWPDRYDDVGEMSSERLVELQLSKSAWHARRARVVLQERAAEGELEPSVHERLRDIFRSNPDTDLRLRAMWALHITGGFVPEQLSEALADRDPHVRAWAIQMLCEDLAPPAATLETFARMARSDDSAVVRLYLAAALQRLDHEARWPIAEALIARAEDAEDHNIPKMLWFAVEPLVAENPGRALELARLSEMPMLVEYVGRRLVDAGELEPLVTSLEDRSDMRAGLLSGMQAGLEGQFDVSPPGNWEPVYTALRKDPAVADIALEISQQFGGIEAAVQFMATLTDESAPTEARLGALRGLAGQQRQELVELLPELLDDPAMRIGVIRAIAAFDEEDLGSMLLRRYDDFEKDEKLEVVQTLASRPIYGRVLVYALENERIPKRDVPAYAARQMRRVVGSGFLEVWGPLSKVSSEKAAAIASYKQLLSDEKIASADLGKGRESFGELCGKCHQLYGEGGILGPDITGSNRTQLDYLLTNIVDPSGDVQDDYRMVMVTTRDGRTYVGNVATESERALTLRVVGQDSVVIAKSDIQSREQSDLSIMPEGLLDAFSENEVVDLVGYLMTTEPVSPN
jgi:putative membrane-bound dehydrogenase-like protein